LIAGATVILLAFRHGLRAAEVCDLRWDQVSFDGAVLHVRRVKDGTPSTHPLLGDELRALRRLQRESVPSPFVFVSERGTPFTTAGFARMIERAAASRRVRQRNCFCCGRGHVEYLLRYEDQAWASNSPGLEAIGRRVAWSKAGHPPLLARPGPRWSGASLVSGRYCRSTRLSPVIPNPGSN
jgi:hypothetical protein